MPRRPAFGPEPLAGCPCGPRRLQIGQAGRFARTGQVLRNSGHALFRKGFGIDLASAGNRLAPVDSLARQGQAECHSPWPEPCPKGRVPCLLASIRTTASRQGRKVKHRRKGRAPIGRPWPLPLPGAGRSGRWSPGLRGPRGPAPLRGPPPPQARPKRRCAAGHAVCSC